MKGRLVEGGDEQDGQVIVEVGAAWMKGRLVEGGDLQKAQDAANPGVPR